jgi:hypothetical protein
MGGRTIASERQWFKLIDEVLVYLGSFFFFFLLLVVYLEHRQVA